MKPAPAARAAAALLLSSLSGSVGAQAPPPQAAPAAPAARTSAPTAADAKAFVDAVNAELKRLAVRSSTSEWIRNTYITDDTERNAAAMSEDLMAYLSKVISPRPRASTV